MKNHGTEKEAFGNGFAARYTGSPVRKKNGDAFLTGRAAYVADVRLPNMLHAAILRSPHAHARIRKIDVSAARAAPSVVRVITGEEVAQLMNPIPHRVDAGEFGGKHADVYCLAVDKVVYQGQPVAAVVAHNANDAAAAGDLVSVDYEVLDPVLDADAALRPGAPLLYEDWDDNVLIEGRVGDGDVEAALAGVEHLLSDEIRIQRYTTAPIETRGCVATRNELGDGLTLYCSCQNPHPLRWMAAQALRIPEGDLRVVVPNVGGAFGSKMHGHPEEILVCLLSKLIGAPVRWVEERQECFLLGGRQQTHRFEVGFDDRGRILGLRDNMVADVGAVGAALAWSMARLTAMTLGTGYRIPACEVRYSCVVTNKSPWASSRGYGKEAACFVTERVVDMIARRLGEDPAEVRRRNFVEKRQFPFRTTSGLNLDSGDYHGVLDKALRLADYEGLKGLRESSRASAWRRGVGIAFEVTPEAAGIPGMLVGDYDTSTVRLDPSGRVIVLTGVTTPGGGNDTGIAQLVADELGVRLDDVSVKQGDTEVCPYGFGNFSGRGLLVGGASAVLAARDIKTKLAAAAALILDGEQDALVFGNGAVTAGSKRIGIGDLAHAVYTRSGGVGEIISPPLESTRTYRPANISHVPDDKGRTQPYPTYSNGAYVAVVDVDSETGKVEVADFVVVHDCGTIINPAFVEGQTHGGVAMGIGGALSERLLYDDQGRLLTNRFKTYLMPRASDVPEIRIGHQVTPSPFTLLGTKGSGEAGVGGAKAAVANAVEDALSDLGVTVRNLPLSPPEVLRMIERARAS